MTKRIQFTSGCPNNCEYCYEPKEIKCFDIDYPITKDLIQILDMNFLANPNALRILAELPKQTYEFVCGVDYRLLTQDICDLMKEKGFIKVRWAWDYSFNQQKIHQKTWRMFKKAGYKSENLSVFVLTNWKIPYTDCLKKLDLLKVWNVSISECCFDGGYKIAKPLYWNIDEIKRFRRLCRKHNHLVKFKLDPEIEKKSPFRDKSIKQHTLRT